MLSGFFALHIHVASCKCSLTYRMAHNSHRMLARFLIDSAIVLFEMNISPYSLLLATILAMGCWAYGRRSTISGQNTAYTHRESIWMCCIYLIYWLLAADNIKMQQCFILFIWAYFISILCVCAVCVCVVDIVSCLQDKSISHVVWHDTVYGLESGMEDPTIFMDDRI